MQPSSYHVLSLSICLLVCAAQQSRSQEISSTAKLRPEVIKNVETQIMRLEEQAKRESAQEIIKPSQEIAYFVLTGLLAHGTEIKKLSAKEAQEMRFRKDFDGRVFQLAEGKRVVVTESRWCFRNGGAISRHAVYYSLRDGKWEKLGEGGIFVEIW